MKIGELIARDLSERIEPVVKVYAKDRLRADLQQFVITDSIAKEFLEIFAAFENSLTTRIKGGKAGGNIGVWVWGFFGSGKSHVAKVVGNLLENPSFSDKKSAIEIFTNQLDDPSLAAGPELKRLLSAIKERSACKTVLFEIKSRQDMANPESVTEICARAFWESLGYAGTLWLARLERRLDLEGQYTVFQEAVAKRTDRSWEEVRNEHGFYVDEIVDSLAEARGQTPEAARTTFETYQRDHARISPEVVVREFVDYLDHWQTEAKPKETHLVFVIDEMGQFIGGDAKAIHELQSIVEQAQAQGRGRIWFICTSQEALERVVDRAGLQMNDLGKLDARFDIKAPLKGEDVLRVVRERLLRKREDKVGELESFYKSNEARILDLSDLKTERRFAVVDEDSFVDSYPFLPYGIPLVQELFNEMRGYKLSGTERSMIGLAQGVLVDLNKDELGRIVPLDLVFDQEEDEFGTTDYLGTKGVQLINKADERIPGTPISPSRVLKVLWLVSRVEWIPATTETLARLIASSVGDDLTQLKKDLEETLQALQKGGYVGFDLATAQYRYLSEEERGIEEDVADKISAMGAGIGVAKRRAREMLVTRVLTRAKWNDFKAPLGAGGHVSFSLSLDDESVSGGGEIGVDLFGPMAAPDLDLLRTNNLGHGTKGRKIWWIADDDPSLIDNLKRAEALEKVLDMPKWRNDKSDETLRVVNDKKKEQAGLDTHIARLLETSVKRGRVLFAGDELELDGSKDIRTVLLEVVPTVAHHAYSSFQAADKSFDERNLPKYLKLNERVQDLDPDLDLFDAEGNLLRNGPLVEAIYDEIERRQQGDESLDGKSLEDVFAAIPFGWSSALVRLVLAAMFRGGAVHLLSPDHDQPLYDVALPGTDQIFTSVQRFRKTKFFPTIGGLSPMEVKDARDALIAMGATNVPDNASALARLIRNKGTDLIAASDKIRQRVVDLHLPFPGIYRDAGALVNPVTKSNDPVEVVRSFIEKNADWADLAAFVRSYDDFVEQSRDRRFQELSALVDLARDVPLQGSQQATVDRALAELDAVIQAEDLLEKWRIFQEAASKVATIYREVYTHERDACVQAVQNLRQDIEALEPFGELTTESRESLVSKYFGKHGVLTIPGDLDLTNDQALVQASSARKYSDLQALRLAVPIRRGEILGFIEELRRKEQGGPPSEPPVSVKIGGFVGHRVTDVNAFVEEWNKIRDEVVAAREADKEVVIEL